MLYLRAMFRALLFLLVFIPEFILAQGKPASKDQFILEFSQESWLNAPQEIKTEWYSWGIGMNFYKDIIINKHWSIAPGASVLFHNVYSNYRFRRDENTGESIYEILTPDSYRNNKIVTQYLDIPLEIRFRGNPDEFGRFLRIYAGAKVGYNISSFSKYVDDNLKVKHYNLAELEDIRYGLTLRLSYSFVGVHVYYSLSELFMENGPMQGMTPLSVGISLFGL
jgi:hypothetical protein